MLARDTGPGYWPAHLVHQWRVTRAWPGDLGRDRGDRLIATVRNPAALTGLIERFGNRIVPLRLDVTRPMPAAPANIAPVRAPQTPLRRLLGPIALDEVRDDFRASRDIALSTDMREDGTS